VTDAVARAQRYSPRPLTAGERWTAQALGALRAGGYSPRAWRTFLADSLERSRATRRARPELARQATAWAVAGAAAWTVACIALDADRRRWVTGLAWWLAVWQMLDWHLGMAEGGDGRRRPRLSPADAVTLTRFWLVPALPPAARTGAALPALIALGGVTDALDGVLARRYGRTRLGRDLDTTADLAFLAVAAAAARRAGRLSRPAAWALGARSSAGVALAAGAVLGRARRPAIRARPWGAALRIGGVALGVTRRRRAGTALVVAGCLVPPLSTAPHLSRA
jgi:phosphatidylglycerophosphate synthase